MRRLPKRAPRCCSNPRHEHNSIAHAAATHRYSAYAGVSPLPADGEALRRTVAQEADRAVLRLLQDAADRSAAAEKRLRAAMKAGLFASVKPAKLRDALAEASTAGDPHALRAVIAEAGVKLQRAESKEARGRLSPARQRSSPARQRSSASDEASSPS